MSAEVVFNMRITRGFDTKPADADEEIDGSQRFRKCNGRQGVERALPRRRIGTVPHRNRSRRRPPNRTGMYGSVEVEPQGPLINGPGDAEVVNNAPALLVSEA